MTTSQPLCNDGRIHNGPFLEFALAIPICMTLQFSLLFHTIYQQHKNKSDRFSAQKKLSLLFIILQCFGLCYTTVDCFGVLIDPFTLIVRNSIGCDIISYGPKLIPMFYYFFYLYQILLRLEASFNDSFLEISKNTKHITSILLVCFFILAPIVVIFVSFNHLKPCLITWKPIDFPEFYTAEAEPFSWCSNDLPFEAAVIVFCSVSLITIVNICFCIVFAVKLKKILYNRMENEHTTARFKSLIIKNCICTTVGALSTVLSYILTLTLFANLEFGVVFIYIDLITNVIVIGLMFSYNKQYYEKWCKCCIVMCFKLDAKINTMKKLTQQELELASQSSI